MPRSLCLALGLLAGLAGPGSAQPAMEAFTLRLIAEAGRVAEVPSVLHRPDVFGERPAIILLPDGSAPDTRAGELAALLVEAGWTVLAMDLDPTPLDGLVPTRSGPIAPGSDPHGAAAALHQILAVLATDPLVDPHRIAAVGLGAGGRAALLAASEALAEAQTGPDGLRFAAHAALYPGCGALLDEGFADEDAWSLAPVALLHAGRDDRDAAEDCGELRDAMRLAGRQPALWQVYPDASYGWDYGDALGRIIRLPLPGGPPVTVRQDTEVASDAADRLVRFLRQALEPPPRGRVAGR
ncbi:hypothetical protein [Muricoccus radiodurans]|uniref:hypothetical protein n=1 Tax=Muricoccus radiodurans TaxID=2231721 RepID=UPI003CF43282